MIKLCTELFVAFGAYVITEDELTSDAIWNKVFLVERYLGTISKTEDTRPHSARTPFYSMVRRVLKVLNSLLTPELFKPCRIRRRVNDGLPDVAVPKIVLN